LLLSSSQVGLASGERMKHQKTYGRMAYALLPVLALSQGCAGSAPDTDAMRTLPLIIKVNHAADESVLRARLQNLATACEVELSYKRPMSGGAHIVQMRAPTPEAALHCLRAQPEVVYVQEDKLARPMTGRGEDTQ